MKIATAMVVVLGLIGAAQAQQIGGFYNGDDRPCCGLAVGTYQQQNHPSLPGAYDYQPPPQAQLPAYMPRQQYLPNQYDMFRR